MRGLSLSLLLVLLLSVLPVAGLLEAGAASTVKESRLSVITTVDALTTAISEASEGDVILVGDIDFSSVPDGVYEIRKNVTIRSGLEINAVFLNASFSFVGKSSASAPLRVTMENIEFRGIDAKSPLDPAAPPALNGKGAKSAGVFTKNSDVTFTSCVFNGYHNEAGGALYAFCESNDSLNLHLNECSFRNNAAYMGGAINLTGTSNNILLFASGCTFEGNGATVGGAVFTSNAHVSFTECQFLNNKFLKIADAAPNGGALFLADCNAAIDGCTLFGNITGGAGGGVYADMGKNGTLSMLNTTVTLNRSQSGDGLTVVSNGQRIGAAQIHFCSIVSNTTAAADGGLTADPALSYFGCVLSGKGVRTDKAYGESNGYCILVSPEEAGKIIPSVSEDRHVRMPLGYSTIPEDVLKTRFGGKYAYSLGKLEIGDNYYPDAAFAVYLWGVNINPGYVSYGGTFSLDPVSRKGYSFNGWRLPDGTYYENGAVFIGGNMTGFQPKADWKWDYAGHEYVIWIPAGLLILLIAAAVFLLIRRRMEMSMFEAEMDEQEVTLIRTGVFDDMRENADLPDGWIDEICADSELQHLLKPTEMDVMRSLLDGLDREEIADSMGLSLPKVRKLCISVYRKLGVANKIELFGLMAQKYEEQ